MKKYESVKTWIREAISQGRIEPGDKLPSESELMQQFGVSRNSVRQAINELSGEGWVETRRGIGTFCLTRNVGRSKLVGVVCLRVGTYIFPRIIQGCNRVLQKNGYRILMNESWYDLAEERRVLEALHKLRIDGIILIPIQSDGSQSNADLVKRIEDDGTAVVLLDNEYPQYRFSSVVLDDHAAGRLAAEHVWNAGHRRIGVLYSSNYRPKLLRMQGVVDFLGERETTADKEWNVAIHGQTSSMRTYGQIRALFNRPISLPTALVCSSDDEALMFIHQARHHGIRVPDDVSVISFDNSDFAKFSRPRLTSLDHPSEYMGELAATMLLAKIQRRSPTTTSRTVIEAELINRESVVQIAKAGR